MNWKPDRHSHLSLHVQIADWMTTLISRGEWTVGMKLPPQRRLAELLDVNRSTIIEVLDELKADGLLEMKRGAGTFVSNNSWNMLLNKSQPNWHKHIEASIHKPNYHTIQLINEYEQDSSMIRLGTGELSPELLPTKLLEQSLQSISLKARDIGYSEPKGSKRLRTILSDYLKKREIHTSPENILIVSGALQALQLISVGLLEQQSIVFQEHPSYLNSVHPFQSAGMQMVSIEQNERLAETLKAAKGKKQSLFYTMPTLHNPTGSSLKLEERQRLLDICTALQIPIVEDDVYYELLFEESLPAIKSLDRTGQVLYLGSVSKTLSPGLRIGWVVAPEPVINRLADIKMQTDYGSSAFSQEIVAYWLSSGLYEEHVTRLRKQLKERALFVETILEKDFGRIATWKKSDGGFYIWLRFNEPFVNKTLFLKLIKQNVLINPGYIYDSQDLHHIRLSYAYANLEELKEGLYILLSNIIR
ncbi:aminotransferase-like domain-containing protein [Psychrobacillus lasiicapitis]|uniref:PLP-dependent aminotransferase family protein n=1 Tax=Psychrobacillus lasiicapitis TaxID=1636719 RepID=A0A544TGU3_9BACI|nr:PLP-dependent aminotransferase family protein [Psychrobacillus lasiicapitis]TQR16630.1 PLP-dependent aminotransferase family protein [Psychrobacillus lasiicapitis]GGA28541.1 putative HTH-type transcriptional regulator YisV [Psychrobacillus lasiicapitis]